ncbi:hypothetical protein [Janthinobacterium fluminis]|uniref:Uncharacterized protein n=1 Tax=Janthinobacterium fluminis TaxID=2987524 RepID=A0ABT5K774_9BURK|nr:hypothetical protein [Janthinobacterium fluminis]MDC8759896.1 hypothetical protein [Janthinobacterium fluminis]
MSNIKIFKFDGAIQGYPESRPSSVAAMRAQLAELVGNAAIVSMHKAALPMKPCPGMPSGSINVYEVTALAWFTLEHRDDGTQGFVRLADFDADAAGITAEFASLRRPAPARSAHPLRTYARDWAGGMVSYQPKGRPSAAAQPLRKRATENA